MQTCIPLPSFDFDAEAIPTQLESLLQKLREQFVTLSQSTTADKSNAAISAIDQCFNELDCFWSPIRHAHSVLANDANREAYQRSLPHLTDFYNEFSLSSDMCTLYEQALADQTQAMSRAQRVAIEHAIRDFKLAGVKSEEKVKARIKAINDALSILATKYANNVMDTTDRWQHIVNQRDELSGLPEPQVALFKERADAEGVQGWLIGLDQPSVQAVLRYADNRTLRETVYHAYTTRASALGPHDPDCNNDSVIIEILSLRQEKARLLGYEDYAEYTLATRMAKNSQEVIDFLHSMTQRVLAQGKNEYAELQAFAAKLTPNITLQPWDVAYYSEKQKHALFQFSSEALRPYFPVEHVLQGMFQLVETLFTVEIHPLNNQDFQPWHEDVQRFEIMRNGQIVGQFIVDLYARTQKKGGAWMDSHCSRMKLSDDKTQLPIAYLTCNFLPKSEENVGLLNHEEVLTLFHEFGHCCHHLLTAIDVYPVSGIAGVPWDGVELPSQLLENWCWHPESLKKIAAHYQTGEPIPEDLVAKALSAKNFQAGMSLLRQLEFALFDFKLHQQVDSDWQAQDVQKLLDEVRASVSVVPTTAHNRFQNAFSHIFAGGYAAGYYSYLWAEVLSSDVFSQFEEKGLFDQATGLSYLKHILSQGGSEDFDQLVKRFLGRDVSIDAFLRHHGLNKAND